MVELIICTTTDNHFINVEISTIDRQYNFEDNDEVVKCLIEIGLYDEDEEIDLSEIYFVAERHQKQIIMQHDDGESLTLHQL